MMSFAEVGKLVKGHLEPRGWWERDDIKELVSCFVVECGELLGCFLNKKEINWAFIAEEIADCQIYLSAIALKTGVDIPQAVNNKIAKNELKYPLRSDDI